MVSGIMPERFNSTSAPSFAVLPFYVSIVPPGPPRWRYRCNACPGSWVHFGSEEAAREFAALHVTESHDGC